MTTHFNGWEDETVDMDTGDPIAVVDGEREDIIEVTYSCVEGCGWTAGAEWHDEITYAKEEEAEQEAKEEAKQNSPQLYKLPIRPADFYEPF